MRPRITGELPSVALLKKYPNWENALDEEGLEGQDESTLRPHPIQDSIPDDFLFTAGEVHAPSGETFNALIEIDYGAVNCVTVYSGSSPSACWSFYQSVRLDGWATDCLASFRNSSEDRTPAPIEDPTVFPLVLETRLPFGRTGEKIVVRVDSVARLPDPLPRKR
ncbi:hypothetical protein [Pseudobythopirellula maris]|uniref:hypothetical protein n=1 Tax=Pseudobythopirellula maris TaxID=2527991 RepID=UPI0011B76EC9|nr:hypothetical protein [Pseudobythopirellula maris]